VSLLHDSRSWERAAALACGIALVAVPGFTVAYKLEAPRSLARFTSGQIAVLAKLNRADVAHLAHIPRIVVPDRWEGDELAYSPMPRVIPQFAQEPKAILVDLSAQVFGAYESGMLVRWGPVSSGDRRHRTPAGTYHLNWHARVRISSENPTWIMPWYFNFASDRGLGLHQYSLPGRPASHGCVRLLAVDARWIYQWGEGWGVDSDTHVTRSGTLVVLMGRYDFTSPPPWLRPEWWKHGVLPRVEEGPPSE